MKSLTASTRILATLAAVALLVMALAIAPGRASAHAKLTGSTPADGSLVQAGLTQVTLTFDDDLSPEQSNAQILQNDGKSVAGTTSLVDKTDRKKVTIQTSPLAEGKYSVKWHAVSADDNASTDGTFGFTVSASGSATPSSGVTTQTSPAGGPLPNTGGSEMSLILGALALGMICLVDAGVALRRQGSR